MDRESMALAARLIRERANEARDVAGASDWFAAQTRDGYCWSVRSSGGRVATDMAVEEAEHIASLNPRIAMLLADVIESAGDVGPEHPISQLVREYLGECTHRPN